MIRVDLANVSAQRTCLPLFEKHQATPFPIFIDAAETADIYSGMAMRRTGESTCRLYDGTSASFRFFGLAAMDRNAVINDFTSQSGSVPFAVWLGGPDAVFEISAPAFDTLATWAVPVDGTRQYVYATSTGKLTTVADGERIAELLEVPSATKIVIKLVGQDLAALA